MRVGSQPWAVGDREARLGPPTRPASARERGAEMSEQATSGEGSRFAREEGAALRRIVKPDPRAYPLPRLTELLGSLGEKPFRARQIFRWLHQRGARGFEEMTDLPCSLRSLLADRLEMRSIELADERRSRDGTIKWKWRTLDGHFIESVYMPHRGGAPDGLVDEEDEGLPRKRDRHTLCVSSQVGCAIGCTFCLTGTMGLARHLSPAEIVDQVHRANGRLVELGLGASPRPLTNLVFMGMGEPLHNYANLKLALEILLCEDGPQFSHRHVTVSTSGLVPQMKRLGEETTVKLALSLNATTDEQRDRLMPVNRRYPIAELMAACRAFPMKQGRRITFEYVLLAGVNDSDEDAMRLAALIEGVPAKVNLIPYNENPGLGYSSPSPERVAAFEERLAARCVTVVVRRDRGRDIAAACGQLAAEGGPGDPRRRQGASAGFAGGGPGPR
jgi:23S rRNA (adenine2503-C2)-methyltransferase